MRASTFQLLCVEEHESQLRALKVLLERHGFHVDGAPSIEAARRLLDGATYDLVIADDGALRGTLPALFESGVLDPDRTFVLSAADRSGAPPGVRVFGKPIEFDRFLVEVRLRVEG